MKTTTVATTVVFAWLACLAPVRAAAPPPVEAFGNRPSVIDIDINPAGTRLAWIEDDGRGAYIVIHDLTTRKNLRRVAPPATTHLRAVYWANDETVLVDQRVTRSAEDGGRKAPKWQRWAAIDATGGVDRPLLMQRGRHEWWTGTSLVRRQTDKAGKVYLSTMDYPAGRSAFEVGTYYPGKKDSGWIGNLYEVDLATGNGKVIASGTQFTVDWLTDAAAEQVVRSDWNPIGKVFEIFVKRDDGWRLLYSAPGCGRLSLVSFTADESAVVLLGETCEDASSKLWSLPLDGSPRSVLLEDPALDVERAILDPLQDTLLGATFSGTEQPTRWIDIQAERRAAALERSFRTSAASIEGRSNDYHRVVVLVEHERQAPVYYLVDHEAKTADIVNEMYPQLAGVELGAVREFQYAARDKYPLMAYLTLPSAAHEKDLPLVVLPHGGPEARDDPGFDWMAQFFASRGYAVLQPQFRGSSGFGREHADAGRRQWGMRMQNDVTDGVRAIIDAGIADPKRICIVGWSYGGYAALAGAAFTPDLYTCAVSIAGVSDLPAMIGYTGRMGGDESNSLAYWREHIGSAHEPHLAAKSPARFAKAVRAPILLLHGTDDTTVPIAQSRLMASALDAAGRKYSFVKLPGDDHHLSASVTRVRMLSEVEKFLALHLATGQVAAQ